MAAIAIVATTALLVTALLTRAVRRARLMNAVLRPEGYQEAAVTVERGYRPATVFVRKGVPVRLRFLRREDEPCSERVVFAHFGVNQRLPPFQETTVDLLPATAGTYLFTCQWGMYRGWIIVRERFGWRSLGWRTARGPLVLGVLLWLCVLPMVFIVGPSLAGWPVTWYLALVTLPAAVAVCWAVCDASPSSWRAPREPEHEHERHVER